MTKMFSAYDSDIRELLLRGKAKKCRCSLRKFSYSASTSLSYNSYLNLKKTSVFIIILYVYNRLILFCINGSCNLQLTEVRAF